MWSKFFPVFLGIVVSLTIVSFTTNLESPPTATPAAMQSAKTSRAQAIIAKSEGPNGVTIYFPLIAALFAALLVHIRTSRIINEEARQDYQ